MTESDQNNPSKNKTLARGVKVLRFWNGNLRRDKDSIRDMIWYALQERAPHSLPEYCRVGKVAGEMGET